MLSIRHALAALTTAATACLAAPAPAGDSFPDEWFFEGANRPQALRQLEGKPAPELATQAWIGDETSLQAARGKVVIVDFWATWCGPCMASIPHNIELVDKYKDRGLVFIGVHDSNSGWDKAPQVVKDKGINYAVAHDNGSSAKSFGVSFWPTYVAIDHQGVVRAAGLIPTHVDEVVERLLAEMPALPSGSGGHEDWTLGGSMRPTWLREGEGKPAPALHPAEWRGEAPQGFDPSSRRGQVTLVQFLSPDSELSLRQLGEMEKLQREFGDQGVAFLAVCDARADWERAKSLFESRAATLPLMRDAPTPPNAAGRATSSPLGATAAAFGVRLAPVTVVIDRAGVVRVAGAKPDKLRDIVNSLLAEPLPAASEAATPAPTSTP